MRNVLLAAAAALALAAAPAFAQEGNGNPFPNTVPGTTAATRTQFADVGSQAYPDVSSRPGSDLAVVADGLLPGVGSEASVQTANSLPRNFEVGTVTYAQAQSVRRYFAGQAERSSNAYAARAATEPSRN